MKASPEELKEARKLEILLSQSRIGVFAGCFVTTLGVLLFWSHAGYLYLLAWLLLYVLLSVVRYHLVSKALQEIPQRAVLVKARRRYTVLTLCSGAAWGLMSLYIMQGETIGLALFVVALGVGMTASVANIYAIYPSIFLAFAVPAMLPVAVYLLLQNGESQTMYGSLILAFLVLMGLCAVQMRKLIMQSIGIQFENLRLLDDIEREKVQISDLNQQLQADLQELRQRDMQLSEEKDKAEDLAKKLLILSTRDGLTGIANRRHFDVYLAKEWNRAVRSGSWLSLIMCDIDHFKAYNDLYGHQKGDFCLQQVSAILEEHTRREGDLAARYGGEEFAIVLPDTSLDQALVNAEKIKAAVENAAIAREASDATNIVTLSMGVSAIKPERSVFSAMLIAKADKLLYRAKAEGRNRIVAEICKVTKPEPEKQVESLPLRA